MRLERIKSLMLKAGFKSYDKLAEALEVKQNTVYRWVAGDREPSIEKLKEMARLFKTSVSYLIDGPLLARRSGILQETLSSGRHRA